jgi:hypothetical protein
MREIPHARGACHLPNYKGAARYPLRLCPDVDAVHAITVIGPLTRRTPEYPPRPRTLAPMPTRWTRLACLSFFLQGEAHSKPLGFVREHVARSAMRPPMDFLMIRRANIIVLPDVSHIADFQRSHACLMQRGDESRGLLVFNIFDLMVEFPELLLL